MKVYFDNGIVANIPVTINNVMYVKASNKIYAYELYDKEITLFEEIEKNL